MRSFRKKIDPKHEAYLALVGSIESQLRDAYARLNEAGLLNQTTLGEKLDVGRSVINRRLSGGANMTIETLAHMCWAMGLGIDVEIFDEQAATHTNSRLGAPPPRLPVHAPAASSAQTVVAQMQAA